MKKLLLVYLSLGSFTILHTQGFEDYFGAGHSSGISISSSDEDAGTAAVNTINGFGLDQHLRESARFLGQSTLGPTYEEILACAEIGPENWIDQQFAMQEANFLDTTNMIMNHMLDEFLDIWGEDLIVGNDNILPYWLYFRMAWWNTSLKAEDQLRHRIALALSEILVISENSDLQLSAQGLADYYDVLYRNAFGNYRDLLGEVTLHPCMGFYLSHLNNEKTDAENNIHPDENYAREVMQLFTIGLYELNQDGSLQLDAEDNSMDTYDNTDIQEFAKIYTGLGPAEYWWLWDDEISNFPVEWNNPLNTVPFINTWTPMQMFEEWHEPGEKNLLNGFVVPSGQSGMEDINSALDNLFNHNNVAPFIGKQLIQRLVKSNPSPEYIERVSDAFNDNGQGVRGDMKAVIKAILLDPEARDCEWIEMEASGKMREPMIRYSQLIRAFNIKNESEKLWALGYLLQETTQQHPLASPSVFNFFLPTFSPNGPIFDQDLVAPEFGLLTSSTSIAWVNLMYDALIIDYYMDIAPQASEIEIGGLEGNPALFAPEDVIAPDFSSELALAEDPDALIDRLDILLTGGTMSDETKETISDTVNPLLLFDETLGVKSAIFLTLISPDYVIQK